MSSSNQTLDTSSSIQKRQIPSVETTTNTLDGNSHDANSHDANNQGANTLDANSHDANSHDANNNDANTLDANNQHQSNSVQEKETIFQYTKVYDNATDSYYYWDEVTDETTWEIPEEYLKLNGDEHRKKLKAKEDEEYFNSKEYHDWYYTQYYPSLYTESKGNTPQTLNKDDIAQLAPVYKDYSASAFFNTKTGKFKNVQFDGRFKPDIYFNQEQKGDRQMSNFFDVARHNEERSFQKRTKNTDAPAKLTKKEVQGFKQKKLDKKRETLKAKYAD